MSGVKPTFAPPKEVRILSVVQVMFTHPQTQNTSVCKVSIEKLNNKLQKLQREGMFVIGVFVTNLDREQVIYQPHSTGGPHV